MIDLYTWGTPNGRKVSIMLEELGIPYNAHEINIGKDEQFDPAFLAISPNNKIPAIVDSEGPGGRYTLFESGAILIYLAERHGKFLPTDPAARYRTMEWLMFQMGGLGPMLGQNHHFRGMDEPDQYGLERYAKETARLYGVLDKYLAKVEYLNGVDYSIADIATYPWIARHPRHKTNLDDYPNVKRWFEQIGKRPAVEKGMAVPFLN